MVATAARTGTVAAELSATGRNCQATRLPWPAGRSDGPVRAFYERLGSGPRVVDANAVGEMKSPLTRTQRVLVGVIVVLVILCAARLIERQLNGDRLSRDQQPVPILMSKSFACMATA